MVMLFMSRQGGYRGDEERAGVLDPMGGGALRSPHAAISGLAPSAAHEGWGQETRATSPQLLTSRAYQRNLGDLRGRTQTISHLNYIYSFSRWFYPKQRFDNIFQKRLYLLLQSYPVYYIS